VIEITKMNALLTRTEALLAREQILRNAELAAAGPEAEHTWRALDLIDLGSQEPKPPEIGGLFYRGKRHVISGEDDAGKTMLLAGISVDELRSDHGVVWIDTDDMGPSMVLERLRAFGADDKKIRELFAYLRPEEALSDAARADVVELIRQRKARLLVNDAFNASLALHGLSPTSTEDVETFWQHVVAPFCRAGVAAAIPDHVVKLTLARGLPCIALVYERVERLADVFRLAPDVLLDLLARARLGEALEVLADLLHVAGRTPLALVADLDLPSETTCFGVAVEHEQA
jgi:hypothetical protein